MSKKKALLSENTIRQFFKLSGQKKHLAENFFQTFEGLNEEEEEDGEDLGGLEGSEEGEGSEMPSLEAPEGGEDLGGSEMPMGGGTETSVEIDDVAAKAIIELAKELESALGGGGLDMGMGEESEMDFGGESEEDEELQEDKMANKGHGNPKSHALKEEETSVEKFAEHLAEQIMRNVEKEKLKNLKTQQLLKKIDKDKLIKNVVKRIVEKKIK